MSMIETDGDFGLYGKGEMRVRAVAKYPDMGPTRQHEPPEYVEDREALRRFEAERKAREEREEVRRERGRALREGAPPSNHGIPFSWAERAIVHRLAAENPDDSARMLCGRFQAEAGRQVSPQTVRNILREPPGDVDAEAARPRIPRRYPVEPDEDPVDPPADDVAAAIGEIDAILKWLPPADRARVRAWFADAKT